MAKLNRTFILLLLLTACSESGIQAAPDKGLTVTPEPVSSARQITLEVYKSPSCGCCQGWIDHVKSVGINTRIHHPADLNALKNKMSIAPQYQSCHTALSADGYLFEGHIPARFVQQFLDNPPADALGLTVPGMPMGSPGMEMGERFTPYQVIQLNRDGSTQVYAEVTSMEQQHR